MPCSENPLGDRMPRKLSTTLLWVVPRGFPLSSLGRKGPLLKGVGEQGRSTGGLSWPLISDLHYGWAPIIERSFSASEIPCKIYQSPPPPEGWNIFGASVALET